jgi:hypothetical protein
MRALSITVLLAAAAAAQSTSIANDPRPDVGVEGSIKVFHVGPYTIPAGRVISGRVIPGEFEQFVPAPNPGDVFMTGFDSRIVDLARVQQDPQVLYLHHGVLVNRRSGLSDLTCPLIPGERFAASGAERIPFALPPGFGYRIYTSDLMICILHMQNFTLTPQTVYYQYSMTVQPGSANLRQVRPWWLDVVNCTSSYVVPAGNGPHVRSADFTVPQRMTMLTLGPHLHCGGVKLDLLEKSNGNRLIYNFPNQNPCPVELRAVIPNPPIVLNQGTVVTIQATYQMDPTKSLDAMGIMLAYVTLGT